MDMVGNLLATERKKKGLEIVDVEQATGIRSAYLQALENGHYDSLPGEVYVKGFIRNYGNYLGLDGSHLVHLYSDSIRENNRVTEFESAQVKQPSRLAGRQTWKIFSTVLVFLLLAASAWGIYIWQKSNVAKPSPVPARQTQTGVSSTTPIPTSPAPFASNTPVQPVQAVVIPQKALVLVAKFNDRCWTSVIADGKAVFEGIPRIGDSLTWEADRQLTANFGNAGAVELVLNGQPVGKIGEKGDVVVKTFSATPQPAGTP